MSSAVAPGICRLRPFTPCARAGLLRRLPERVRASAEASPATGVVDRDALFRELDECAQLFQKADPTTKLAAGNDVAAAMAALREAGAVPQWGSWVEDVPARRTIMIGELRQMGIKNPDKMAIPSVRNDAAFLAAVVGSTSVLAVLAGQLPGDWGFFSSYLIGGITLGVLAVGSTAPGLLQVAIDLFSQLFPDYRQRVVRHEAAHFLAGYLLGVPVAGYSLLLGKEHTEFAETKLQRRLIEGRLDARDVDAFSVISVAGITAEALAYDEVLGQTADLLDLQRLLLRSKEPLSSGAQQNQTRWAVWAAAIMLRAHRAQFEALQDALARGAGVAECVRAIEAAAPPPSAA